MPPEPDLLDLADDELHTRLVQRHVDEHLATLLIESARADVDDAIDLLREILT